MSDDKKDLLKKFKELLGKSGDPFEVHLGPTKECLTSNQVVALVQRNEGGSNVLKHLENCEFCRKRLENLKKLINP